jgi:hypothetical protein
MELTIAKQALYPEPHLQPISTSTGESDEDFKVQASLGYI